MTALHQRRAEAPPAQLAIATRLLGADGQPVDIRAAAAAERGVFEGYAMLWDTTDAYGTRFAPGSFGAGGLDGGLYALLVMHDPNRAAGTFTAREDERGLWIAGGWDGTAEGNDARARAKSGSADGLSVGFVPLMLDPDDEARFTQARLVEVSQITARMAAVPGAGFSSARSTLPHGVPGQEVQVPGHRSVEDAAVAAAAVLALSALR